MEPPSNRKSPWRSVGTMVAGVAIFLYASRPAGGAPVVTIGDASALEPPFGSGEVALLVSVSEVTPGAVTVDFQSIAGTADPLDFVDQNGTIEIPAGQTRGWIRLAITQDSLTEDEETFTVHLSNPSGASLGRASGRVSILDAGPRPIITADPATLYEDGPGTVGRVVARGSEGRTIDLTWQQHGWTGAVATQYFHPAIAGADFLESRSVAPLDREVQFRMVALSDTEREPALTAPVPEVLSLSVEANQPVAYATYAPVQFLPRPISPEVDDESRFQTTATTDGEWIASGRARTSFPPEEPNPQVLDLWRRSPLDRQHWDRQQGLNLRALNQNRATAFNEMILRRGRLALSTNLGLLVLASADDNGNEWKYAGLVPYTPSQGGAWAFDGDTLVVAEGFSTGLALYTRLSFYERLAPFARWALVTQKTFNGGRPRSVTVNGDLALMSMEERPLILQWKRNGTPDVPWTSGGSFPGGDGANYTNLALGNAVLFAAQLKDQADDSSQKGVIFMSSSAGEWRAEPTATNSFPLASLTAFDVTRATVTGPLVAHTRYGEPGVPWRITPERFGLINMDVGTVAAVDSHNGVLLQRLLAPEGASAVVVSTGGAPLTLVDDEDFRWAVGPPILENIQYIEPVSGPLPTDLIVRTNRAVPFPVSVRVRTVPTGSATPGLDYVPFDRRVFIPANADQAWLGLTILGDIEIENPETFVVEILEPSYGQVDSPSVRTITLLNRVITTVTTPNSTVAIFETDTASSVWSIPFQLSVSLPSAVSFPVIVEAATATPDADFSIATTMLDVPAGQRSFVLPVTVFADTLIEPTETFRIRLGAVPGVDAINLPSVVINLMDRFSDNESGVTPDAYAIPQNLPFSAGHPGDPSPGVLDNDPGKPDVVRLTYPPAVGELRLNGAGGFTFAPPPNFMGALEFAYEAASGSGLGTLVDAAAPWRYLHPLNGADPASSIPAFDTTWQQADFDDSAWTPGTGLMGYGGLGVLNIAPDTEIGTPPTNARFTAYFRHAFPCPTPGSYDLTLQFICDDAAIFYVNGQELGRYVHNLAPQFLAGADRYSLLVDSAAWVDGNSETALGSLTLRSVPLGATGNVLAVSVHNGSPASSDLGFRLTSLVASEPWSSSTSVALTVADAMVPPVLVADAYEARQNQVLDSRSLSIGGLFANDGLFATGGPPFDPILEATTSRPSSGSIDLDAQSGEFRYTPEADYFGPASFTYRVRDKDGWSSPALVTLNIRPIRSFDVWRQRRLGTTTPDDASAPASDPDANGLTNLEEFFFGDGVAPASEVPLSPLALELSASGAPRISFPFNISDGWVMFPNDVEAVLESSSSLNSDAWESEFRWEAGVLTFVKPDVVFRRSTSGTFGLATIDTDPFQLPPRFFRLNLKRSPP